MENDNGNGNDDYTRDESIYAIHMVDIQYYIVLYYNIRYTMDLLALWHSFYSIQGTFGIMIFVDDHNDYGIVVVAAVVNKRALCAISSFI